MPRTSHLVILSLGLGLSMQSLSLAQCSSPASNSPAVPCASFELERNSGLQLELGRTAATLELDTAKAGGAQEEPAAETETKRERPRKRLLHLPGGKVLRASARPCPEGWEVRRGGEWMVLPAAAVVRVHEEADVLKQLRELRSQIERDSGPEPLAELARWEISQGLYAEGLRELDRLLEEDPDCAAALRILAQNAPPLAIPTWNAADGEDLRGAYFQFTGQLRPAEREIALARTAAALNEAAQREAYAADLVRELRSRSAGRRSFASLALRRLYPGEAPKELLSRAILDSSRDVRLGAALALRDAQQPALILPAVRALGSSSQLVRANAAEALGSMSYAAAVGPLISALQSSGSVSRAPAANIFVGKQTAYVQDFDVEVAQFEAIADPVINILTEGAVLDARVMSTSQSSGSAAQTRASIRRSLEHLTGAKPGNSTRAWERWWETNGEEWNRNLLLGEELPTSEAGSN